MLNHHFHHMRDIKRLRHEKAVTETRVCEAFKCDAGILNMRVDVANWDDKARLAVKFEWSKNGKDWFESGTFPIHEGHHGVVLATFGDHLRYTLLVEGTNPCLDVDLWF